VIRGRPTRLLWLGAAAILVAAALIAIAALVRGELTETDGRILATLGAIVVTGAVAVAGLAVADRGRQAVGTAAAALAVPQLGMLVVRIWSEPVGDTTERLTTSTLVLLAAEAAVLTQLLLHSVARLAWLVTLTGGLVTLAAALTIGAVWTEPESETYGRLVIGLWILALLGWLLLPVLQRFTSAGAPPEAIRVLASLGDVELVAVRGHPAGVDTVQARLEPGERLALRRR
jgi:hypothetical protein